MKSIMALILLSGMTASAKIPSVKCQLTYSALNAKGAMIGRPETNEAIKVQIAETPDSNEGFDLKAILNRVCATTHGPCYDAYDLELTISKGGATTYLNEHITPGQAKSRIIYVALDYNNEQGSVRCLIGAGSLPKPQ